MIATKDQERKALEKIKKIISELGENSYLKMAFDGCFEIAESNIDNDFGDSPRENMECAEKEIRECKNKIEQLSCENEVLNWTKVNKVDKQKSKIYRKFTSA